MYKISKNIRVQIGTVNWDLPYIQVETEVASTSGAVFDAEIDMEIVRAVSGVGGQS